MGPVRDWRMLSGAGRAAVSRQEPPDTPLALEETVDSGGGQAHAETVAAPRAGVAAGSRVPGGESSLPDASTIARPAAGGAAPPIDLPVVARESYEILAEHSRGGLGRILRARDRRTGRVVAIKEVLRDHRETAARFQREAMLTANLQHPAIVPVYEVGRWPDGTPFYAMKLVAGRSLAGAIGEAGTREARLALLPHVIAVADALAYAHDLGVIHRDLKPANVLVGRFGETVVIDWGLAKEIGAAESAAPGSGSGSGTGSGSGSGTGSGSGSGSRGGLTGSSGDAGLTVAGSLLGTPAYMAPEQARGEELDARADVYALGAMLYHLLAGQMPYASASSVEQLLDWVRTAPPRPLGAIDAELPPDLVAIAEKAMAARRSSRYASAGEMAEDLRRFQTGQLVRAHDYSIRQLAARWIGRHRALVAMAAAALCALAGVGVFSVMRVRGERDVAMRALDAETRARGAATRNMAALHQELGREELDRGDDQRALVHLAETARLAGRIGPGLAHLVGRATWPLDALLWVDRAAGGATEPAYLGLAPDGASFLVAYSSGRLERRDAASGRLISGHDTGFRIAGAHSADGRWLAAAGRDLLAWDAAGSGEVHRLAGSFEEPYVQVAITPGGLIAAGDVKGRITLLRAGSPTPVARWQAHGGPIGGLAWRPDGAMLVSKAEDGTAAAWDASGRKLAALAAGGGAHNSPAFDRRGERFAVVAASAREAVLYRGRDAEPVARLAPVLRGEQSFVADAILDPDGRRAVLTLSDGQPILFDAGAARVIAELPGHSTGVVSAAFSHDGGLLATADGRGTLRIWDPATGQLTRVHALARGTPFALAAHPGAPRFTMALDDDSLEAWQVRDPARLVLRGHTDQARRAVYAPDGARVFTASQDRTVRAWDTRDGRELLRIEQPGGRAIALELSRDGGALLTAGADGSARIWDAATGALRVAFTGHAGELSAARFLPGGARVATAGRDGTVRVWSMDGRQLCASKALETPIFAAVLAPAGSSMLAQAEGPESALVSTEDCRILHAVATGHDVTVKAQFAPDGRTVALAGYVRRSGAPSVVLVDVASGAVRPLATPHGQLMVGLAFHPDGTRVATGETSGAIRVFDTATLAQLAVLEGGTTQNTFLTYDPRGELLVSAFDDGSIRIWDVATGRPLTTLTGHRTGVYWLEVRPDGRQLASAALEPDVHLWSLPRFAGSPADLARLVRCRIPWRLADGMPAPAVPTGECAR